MNVYLHPVLLQIDDVESECPWKMIAMCRRCVGKDPVHSCVRSGLNVMYGDGNRKWQSGGSGLHVSKYLLQPEETVARDASPPLGEDVHVISAIPAHGRSVKSR